VGAEFIFYAYGSLMILIGIIILILLVRSSKSESRQNGERHSSREKEFRLKEKERRALESGVYYTKSHHFDSFDELITHIRKKSTS
jgi:hypothetical protein